MLGNKSNSNQTRRHFVDVGDADGISYVSLDKRQCWNSPCFIALLAGLLVSAIVSIPVAFFAGASMTKTTTEPHDVVPVPEFFPNLNKEGATAAAEPPTAQSPTPSPIGVDIVPMINSTFQIGDRLQRRQTCQTYANDQDLQNAGITEAAKSWCSSYYGKTPDAVHVNADGYDYKMCITAGQAQFTSLQPQASTRAIVSDSFSNNLQNKIPHTFSLQGTTSDEISIQTTNTVSLSATVGYEIQIPELFKSTFSVTTGFSSSRATTQKDSKSVTFTSTSTVDVPPGCTVKASIKATTSIYSSSFQVPICLQGYVRCQYGKRINDPKDSSKGSHYYWYNDLGYMNLKGCWTQKGGLASSISIDSKTTYDFAGKCDKK